MVLRVKSEFSRSTYRCSYYLGTQPPGGGSFHRVMLHDEYNWLSLSWKKLDAAKGLFLHSQFRHLPPAEAEARRILGSHELPRPRPSRAFDNHDSKASLHMRVRVPVPTSSTDSMQSTRPLPVPTQMSPIPIQPPLPTPAANKKPHAPRKGWHVPRLLFQVKDVCHPGAVKYFRTTNTETLLRDAVVGVLEKLYTYDTAPTRLAHFILYSSDVRLGQWLISE